MTEETSCGAIVYTGTAGTRQYLMVRSLSGVWGFPKGHREGRETETEAALREVREETALRVTLLPGFRAENRYRLPKKPDTVKRVVYFLGHFKGQTPQCQREELSDLRLCSVEEALSLLPFESTRHLLKKAETFIHKNTQEK